MESAGIESMILNTVALAFILTIDELICSNLFTGRAKYMLERLEPRVVLEPVSTDDMDVWQRHQEDRQWKVWQFDLHYRIFPMKLFFIGAITGFFITKYYFEHCHKS